jgi:hypothetical protein
MQKWGHFRPSITIFCVWDSQIAPEMQSRERALFWLSSSLHSPRVHQQDNRANRTNKQQWTFTWRLFPPIARPQQRHVNRRPLNLSNGLATPLPSSYRPRHHNVAARALKSHIHHLHAIAPFPSWERYCHRSSNILPLCCCLILLFINADHRARHQPPEDMIDSTFHLPSNARGGSLPPLPDATFPHTTNGPRRTPIRDIGITAEGATWFRGIHGTRRGSWYGGSSRRGMRNQTTPHLKRAERNRMRRLWCWVNWNGGIRMLLLLRIRRLGRLLPRWCPCLSSKPLARQSSSFVDTSGVW